MRKRNLATVFLAAPTSTDARLKQIAQASSGFVYAVSRTGVTGARQQMPEDAPKLVGRLRRYTDLPVAVGFGISTAEQVEAVGKFADAAVVGSAIVEIIERNPGKEAESVAQFVKQLSAVSRQPSVSRASWLGICGISPTELASNSGLDLWAIVWTMTWLKTES